MQMKSLIQKLNLPLRLMGIKQYASYNKETANLVAVFESKGKDKTQFVFVPGMKNVMLGWDNKSCTLNEKIIAAMKESLEEEFKYDLQDWEENEEYREKEDMPPEKKTIENWLEYVNSTTSPIRSVDIEPMIVQVVSTPAEKEYKSEIKPPFVIPTENEWEYLRGGGQRIFFPWGDFLEAEIISAIYGMSMSEGSQEHYATNIDLLDKPNMFGLWFDLSTYTYELVNSKCFVKGADGGCSVCGGEGLFYTIPILSNFYRSKHSGNEDRISANYYSYRKIIHI